MRTLIVAVGIALCGGDTGASTAADFEPMVPEAVIERNGFDLAFGFDSLWMPSEGSLIRVDPSTNGFRVIRLPSAGASGSLPEIDKYRGIAVGEDAIWLPDMASSSIYRIDPIANAVTLVIPTDIFGGDGSIGAGEGAVWVTTFEDHNKTLVRYSSTTGEEVARIKLPRAGVGVSVGFGSVWVTAANAPELYKIDPATNAVALTIPIHGSTSLLTTYEGSVWLSFEREGIVQRVDAQSGEIVATIPTGVANSEQNGDITAGGGFVWTISNASVVAQIDVSTNTVIRKLIPQPGTIMGRRIRFGADALWVSGGSIFRVAVPD